VVKADVKDYAIEVESLQELLDKVMAAVKG
jgi:hypothetical protein